MILFFYLYTLLFFFLSNELLRTLRELDVAKNKLVLEGSTSGGKSLAQALFSSFLRSRSESRVAHRHLLPHFISYYFLPAF